MDGGQNGHSSACLQPEHLDNPQSRVRIESGRWLVKEQETWIFDELVADGRAFPFATWNSFDQHSADKRVLAIIQSEYVNHWFNS